MRTFEIVSAIVLVLGCTSDDFTTVVDVGNHQDGNCDDSCCLVLNSFYASLGKSPDGNRSLVWEGSLYATSSLDDTRLLKGVEGVRSLKWSIYPGRMGEVMGIWSSRDRGYQRGYSCTWSGRMRDMLEVLAAFPQLESFVLEVNGCRRKIGELDLETMPELERLKCMEIKGEGLWCSIDAETASKFKNLEVLRLRGIAGMWGTSGMNGAGDGWTVPFVVRSLRGVASLRLSELDMSGVYLADIESLRFVHTLTKLIPPIYYRLADIAETSVEILDMSKSAVPLDGYSNLHRLANLQVVIVDSGRALEIRRALDESKVAVVEKIR